MVTEIHSAVESRFEKRVRWAAGHITGFVESRDVVSCRNHGIFPYFGFKTISGYYRVCEQCVAEYFKETTAPEPPEEEIVLDKCFVEACCSTAPKANRCKACQELFCDFHMSGNVCCEMCVKEADKIYGTDAEHP